MSCWQRSLATSVSVVADPGGRAVEGVGLRQFACQDCGFESRCLYGRLSLVSVCVLSRSGPRVGLITRPEESYRVWCV